MKRTTKPLAAALSIALAWLVGCGGDAPAQAMPLATLAPSSELLVGHVDERLTAGGYTYVAIRGADGEQRWAVVMGAAPPVGAAISVRSMGTRAEFRSQRLGRTFAGLHFATLKPERST